MIRNEREYRASLAHRRRLLAARAAHEAAPQADAEAQVVLLAGVAELLGDVEAELAEYEQLRRGVVTALEVVDLAALPDALVRARIAAGLSQRALAARLGVSEEQVRKDEYVCLALIVLRPRRRSSPAARRSAIARSAVGVPSTSGPVRPITTCSTRPTSSSSRSCGGSGTS
jgi:hypothetical protein